MFTLNFLSSSYLRPTGRPASQPAAAVVASAIDTRSLVDGAQLVLRQKTDAAAADQLRDRGNWRESVSCVQRNFPAQEMSDRNRVGKYVCFVKVAKEYA